MTDIGHRVISWENRLESSVLYQHEPLANSTVPQHFFSELYVMDSEIVEPCEAPDSSNSKTITAKDTPLMSVPALHLVTPLICGHQHNLHHVETKLRELLQHQEILSEGVQSENERFKIAETAFHLPTLFQEISRYNQKLIHLKDEMAVIAERTSRMKKRATRLQQQQQQKALNLEQERARQAEREKHLIAKPVWATKQDDP
ncbi:Biogenesis of lysosome-related organelles complex 1 subunit 6 [Chionoecetes opilio]|uniref:Biogenesis of lysosome-related organelles complex 1 subunit 6 n=1 Tax=Chionoecetes opilio TaxID=41210 RepID=A0A8J4YF55_CHIOP|nr:Biogenesis of lysosome-related organelles complex 1 subunit 6 [Chionoecetes opilio]